MNSVGPAWGTEYQINCDSGYKLPDLNQPGFHGVGVYWLTGRLLPDPNPPGYPTTVVRSPSGTILLAEETGGQQCEGNQWTCVCIGPESSQNGSANGNLYQIDTTVHTPKSHPAAVASIRAPCCTRRRINGSTISFAMVMLRPLLLNRPLAPEPCSARQECGR